MRKIFHRPFLFAITLIVLAYVPTNFASKSDVTNSKEKNASYVLSSFQSTRNTALNDRRTQTFISNFASKLTALDELFVSEYSPSYLSFFVSPAVTGSVTPSSRTVGVTPVSIVGTATANAQVRCTETGPDGNVDVYFTNANSSGNFTFGPFIIPQLGTYSCVLRDMVNGQQTTVTYSGSGNFSVSVSPSSRTINAGQSASYTATFTSVSGFAGSVTPLALNWSNVPNSTASWSSNSVNVPSNGSVQATFTINTSSNTTGGTYGNIILQGRNGSVTRSASAVSLTVNSTTVNLTMSLCPSSPTVGVTNVSFCGNATPNSTVTETIDTWPDGTVHGPYSTTANSSGTYTMGPFILQQLGQYTGTLRDSISGQQIPISYSGVGNFSASVNPTTRTINAGQSASYTVTFTSISGFAGTVEPAALNWSQVPNATASWSANQVTVPSNGSVTATFTIQTGANTAAGTYSNITLQGANGSQTRAASPVSLMVNAGSTLTWALSPANPIVGVTNVSIVGTATPGATVTENETWPDGTVHGPYTTTANGSGNYVLGPFILQQLGNYSGTLGDSITGQQIPINYGGGGNFSASVNTTNRTISPGQTASFGVTFNSISGFAGTVIPAALNWSQIPGATASWSPSQVTVPSNGSVTSTFTIQTSANTSAGTYGNITLQGANGSQTRTAAPVSVTVSGNNSAPSISGLNLQVPVNQPTVLQVSGANFQNGFSAFVTTPLGTFEIAPAGLTYISSSQVRVQVTMNGTPPYNATLRITNPNNQSATRTFEVVSVTPAPVITGPLDPPVITANLLTEVTVNGNNFPPATAFIARITDDTGTTEIPLSGRTRINSNQVKLKVTVNGSTPFAPSSGTAQICDLQGRCTSQGFSISGNPSPPSSTLQIKGIEVTQGIQDMNTSFRKFAAGRPTFVRVHTKSTSVDIFNVNTKLVVRRGTTVLGTLTPIAGILVLQNPSRSPLGDSFLFKLKPEWLSGTITMEFSGVSHQFSCESTSPCNQLEITFTPVSPIQIQPVKIRWTGIAVSDQDIERIKDEIYNALPLGAVEFLPAIYLELPHTEPAPTTSPSMLNRVAGLCNGCTLTNTGNKFYLGLIKGAGGGRGHNPGFASVSFSEPNGPFVRAHELAHNLGRCHTNYGGAGYPQPECWDMGYRYSSGRISSDLSDRGFFGFNLSSKAIYSPNSYRDLMAYDNQIWASDYTFNGIINKLSNQCETLFLGLPCQQVVSRTCPTQRLFHTMLVEGQPATIIRGMISANGSSGQISSLYSMLSSLPTGIPNTGEYAIRFENNGNILATYNFEPESLSEGDGMTYNLVLPYNAAATKVALLKNGIVLAERQATANTPTVTVTSPNGGEILTGSSATLQWTASDPDGNSLTYIIQYSSDGGATWQTIASDWTSTTYPLSLETISGTDLGLVRVIASDGFHSTQDQSDNYFSVNSHAPQATIRAPLNGSYVVGDQNITLDGSAIDAEDGQLGNSSLFWSSDLNGSLGNGQTVSINALDLSEGLHTITLTARDSSNQTGTASITIRIYRTAPTIPTTLTAAPTGLSFIAQQGSTNLTQPQTLSVRNDGQGTLNWSATANQNWIQLSETSGTAPSNASVRANPTALAVGTYTGTITINSPEATNGQQTVGVTLTIVSYALENAPFDFDGDGKTDIGIYRPNVGEWWINRSSDGSTFAAQFGASTDKITPGDFTGDGKTDIAFWRPSNGFWFVLRSEDFSFFSFPYGTNGDIPAPADFDNDGKADAAVFRPSDSTWFIRRSTDGGSTIQQFGQNGDVPVVSDYDGDGKADIAIYRVALGEWWIQRSTAGIIAFQFGNSADKPVPGDFTGDGKADVAIWRPSTGEWFVLRSENQSYYSFPFGTSGDVPAPGDYDGDGKFDATVFRPSSSTWYAQRSTAGTLIQGFGQSGDKPVPNAFVP